VFGVGLGRVQRLRRRVRLVLGVAADFGGSAAAARPRPGGFIRVSRGQFQIRNLERGTSRRRELVILENAVVELVPITDDPKRSFAKDAIANPVLGCRGQSSVSRRVPSETSVDRFLGNLGLPLYSLRPKFTTRL